MLCGLWYGEGFPSFYSGRFWQQTLLSSNLLIVGLWWGVCMCFAAALPDVLYRVWDEGEAGAVDRLHPLPQPSSVEIASSIFTFHTTHRHIRCLWKIGIGREIFLQWCTSPPGILTTSRTSGENARRMEESASELYKSHVANAGWRQSRLTRNLRPLPTKSNFKSSRPEVDTWSRNSRVTRPLVSRRRSGAGWDTFAKWPCCFTSQSFSWEV